MMLELFTLHHIAYSLEQFVTRSDYVRDSYNEV